MRDAQPTKSESNEEGKNRENTYSVQMGWSCIRLAESIEDTYGAVCGPLYLGEIDGGSGVLRRLAREGCFALKLQVVVA